MSPLLVPLLLPLEKDDDANNSVSCLLEKMKACVDTYASRLKYVFITVFVYIFFIFCSRIGLYCKYRDCDISKMTFKLEYFLSTETTKAKVARIKVMKKSLKA